MTYETREAREAYCDGYRDGMGSAIARIDAVSREVPGILSRACPGDHSEILLTVHEVLGALMKGLRMVSASVVLGEDWAQQPRPAPYCQRCGIPHRDGECGRDRNV